MSGCSNNESNDNINNNGKESVKLTFDNVPDGLIAAGEYAVSAIKEDGTVFWVQADAWYDGLDLSQLTDITFIDSEQDKFISIDKNGNVNFSSNYTCYNANLINSWEDIVDVSIGYNHVVGLTASGDLKVAYNTNLSPSVLPECNIANWTDIKDIKAGTSLTVGLKSDGTVVAVGDNEWGECDVLDWTDIISISASSHTVGLKSDGTVVATGRNKEGQCNVSGWTDIVAIATNNSTTFGLKSDGTVISAGGTRSGYGSENREWDVTGLTDIIAIDAEYGTFVGLKSDGTVVVKGEPEVINAASTWNGLKTSNK